jgi:hypothetical protein
MVNSVTDMYIFCKNLDSRLHLQTNISVGMFL